MPCLLLAHLLVIDGGQPLHCARAHTTGLRRSAPRPRLAGLERDTGAGDWGAARLGRLGLSGIDGIMFMPKLFFCEAIFFNAYFLKRGDL